MIAETSLMLKLKEVKDLENLLRATQDKLAAVTASSGTPVPVNVLSPELKGYSEVCD